MENHLVHIFENGLREAYYIEKNLIKVLQELHDSSLDKDIKDSFMHHLKETEEQIKRLEKIFKMRNNTNPHGKTSHVLDGLIEDRKVFINEKKHSPQAIEFFNLGAAVKTERIERSLYEMLVRIARKLDLDEVKELLKMNLKEEKEALKKVRHAAKNYDLDDLKGDEK